MDELVSGKSTSKAEGIRAPQTVDDVSTLTLGTRDFTREMDKAAKFSIGDAVKTNADGVLGHTRLPAYARGRTGVIEDLHGGHVFPDKAAHGEDVGEHLYTVTFAMGDVFPEHAGSEDCIALNLWESYLERV